MVEDDDKVLLIASREENPDFIRCLVILGGALQYDQKMSFSKSTGMTSQGKPLLSIVLIFCDGWTMDRSRSAKGADFN